MTNIKSLTGSYQSKALCASNVTWEKCSGSCTRPNKNCGCFKDHINFNDLISFKTATTFLVWGVQAFE